MPLALSGWQWLVYKGGWVPSLFLWFITCPDLLWLLINNHQVSPMGLLNFWTMIYHPTRCVWNYHLSQTWDSWQRMISRIRIVIWEWGKSQKQCNLFHLGRCFPQETVFILLKLLEDLSSFKPRNKFFFFCILEFLLKFRFS